MSSRTSSRAASPWWVPLDPSAGEVAPRGRPRLLPSAARGERAPGAAAARDAPRFEGSVAQGGHPARAALLLAALWVGLWAVFTAGVVLPAAAVHGAPPAAGREAP